MKSFWWLIQRVLLVLLVGAAPTLMSACGDDDPPAGQLITLINMVVEEDAATIDVGDSSSHKVASVTVKLGSADEEQDFVLSQEELDTAVEDGELSQSQADAILEAVATLTWSSADEDIASVEADEGEDGFPSVSAEVTGEGAGDVTITASVPQSVADPEGFEEAKAEAEAEEGDDFDADAFEGTPVEATVSIKVEPAEAVATGLSASPDELELAVGETATIAAVLELNDESTADADDATFESDDTDVAEVDDNGEVTAVAEGDAVITVTSGEFTATVQVTVAGSLELMIDAGNGTVVNGETLALTATVNGMDVTSEVAWESQDPGVATVDAQGVVTGVSEGQATIVGTYMGEEFTVTVTSGTGDITELQLSANSVVIPVGLTDSVDASAVFQDGSTDVVSAEADWASSDEGVVTVAGGDLVGVALGMATVTATWEGLSAVLMVEVSDAEVMAIAVSPVNNELAIGATETLSAIGTLSNGESRDVTGEATWASSDVGIVTVADNVATGAGVGTASVTATIDGAVGTANFVVSDVLIAEVQISPNPLAVVVGVAGSLTATAVYSDGQSGDVTDQVTWASDNGDIVVAGGVVNASASGTATVTATIDNGDGTPVSGSGVVAASAPELESISAGEALTLADGSSAALTVVGSYNDGSTLDVTTDAGFSSANTDVATVTADGLVTAIAAGETAITASFGGFTASVTVTVSEAVIATIQISPTNVPDLGIGNSFMLTAIATLTDGTTQDVTADANLTWSSSETAAIAVDQDGVISAPLTAALGATATITARYVDVDAGLDVSGSTDVAVRGTEAVSILVSPEAATVGAGFSIDFTATATYGDGSSADVTNDVAWSTGDTAIATYSIQGNVAAVLGVAEGTTTVTASLPTTSGTPLTDDGMITVTDADLTQISVSASADTLAKGGTIQFTATGSFDDGSTQDITRQVSWTVAQPEECLSAADDGNLTTTGASLAGNDCVAAPGNLWARISNEDGTEGQATALESTVEQGTGGGTAVTFKTTITASYSGVSGLANLGVTSDEIDSVEVFVATPADSNSLSLPLGEQANLKATCTFSDNTIDTDCESRLDFTSSATNVVAIDPATLTATAVGVGGSVISVVTPPTASSSFAVTTKNVTVRECDYDTTPVLTLASDLPLGANTQAYLTLNGATVAGCNDFAVSAGTVNWTPSSGNISVSSGGLVTAASTPSPAVDQWTNIGGDPGLNVNLIASHTDSGGTVRTVAGTVTLRDACVNMIAAQPAIHNVMPVPSANPGGALFGQDLLVQASFSVSTIDPVSVEAASSGLSFSLVNAPSGVTLSGNRVQVAAGTPDDRDFQVEVAATSGIVVGGTTYSICTGTSAPEDVDVDLSTTDSAVTGLTIVAPKTTLGVGEGPTQLRAFADFADDSIPLWDVTTSADWATSDSSVQIVGLNDGIANKPGAPKAGVASITATFLGATDDELLTITDRTLVAVHVGVADSFQNGCADFLSSGTKGTINYGDDDLLDIPVGIELPLVAIEEYSNGDYVESTSATFSLSSGSALATISGSTLTTVGVGAIEVSAMVAGITSNPAGTPAGSILAVALDDYDVLSLSLSGGASSIPAGSSSQFEAIANFEESGAGTDDGNCQVSSLATWTLSPASVGTVVDGLVTPGTDQATNTTTVAASFGGEGASQLITVTGGCANTITPAATTATVLASEEDGATDLVNLVQLDSTVTLSDGSNLGDGATDITYAVEVPSGSTVAVYTTSPQTSLQATITPTACPTITGADFTGYTCYTVPNQSNAYLAVEGTLVTDMSVLAIYDDSLGGQANVAVCGAETAIVASAAIAVTSTDAVSSLTLDCGDEGTHGVNNAWNFGAGQGPNFGRNTFQDLDGSGSLDLPEGVNGYCRVLAGFVAGDDQNVTDQATFSTSNTGVITFGTPVQFTNPTTNQAEFFVPVTLNSGDTSDQTIAASYGGVNSSDVTFRPTGVSTMTVTVTTVMDRVLLTSVTADDMSLLGTTAVAERFYAAAAVGTGTYEVTDLVSWSTSAGAPVNVDTGLVTPVTCGSPTATTGTVSASLATIPDTGDSLVGSVVVSVYCDDCSSLVVKRGTTTVADDSAETVVFEGEVVQYSAICNLANSAGTLDVTDAADWSISVTTSRASIVGKGQVRGDDGADGEDAATHDDGLVTARLTVGGDVDEDSFQLDIQQQCLDNFRLVELQNDIQEGDTIPSKVPAQWVLQGIFSGDTEYTNLFSNIASMGYVDSVAGAVTIDDMSTWFNGVDAVGPLDLTDITDAGPGQLNKPVCSGVVAADITDLEVSYTVADADTEGLTLVSADTGALADGDTRQFEARASFDGFAQGYNVTILNPETTFTSSLTSVATIASPGDGLATAVDAGTTVISASFDGFAATSPLTVTDAVPTTITSVKIFDAATAAGGNCQDYFFSTTGVPGTFVTTTEDFPQNFTTRVVVEGSFSDGGTGIIDPALVTFAAEDASVSIDAAGVVNTGASAINGTRITASIGAATNQNGSVLLNVVGGLSLTSMDVLTSTSGSGDEVLLDGVSSQLVVEGTFTGTGGDDFCITPDVTFPVVAGAAANVAADGTVTGVAVGTETVTVNNGGLTDIINVVVSNALISSIALDLSGTQILGVGETLQVQVLATLTDGSVVNLTNDSDRILWITDNDASLTVDTGAVGADGATVAATNVSVNAGLLTVSGTPVPDPFYVMAVVNNPSTNADVTDNVATPVDEGTPRASVLVDVQ